MWQWFSKFFKFSRAKKSNEIFPDEIFLDASNLPEYDTHQFEGRIEKPIQKYVVAILAGSFIVVGVMYMSRLWSLQVTQAHYFLEKSENNRLRHTTIFAERGLITDRNGFHLAWNVTNPDNPDFALRQYIGLPAFSHILGYLKYPSKDVNGYYYSENYEAKDGVEKYFDSVLSGKNGVKLTETNASGKIQSENILQPPQPGKMLTLSIESDLQKHMYESIRNIVMSAEYQGGVGALMDVKTGEVLAMANYPSYDNNVMTDGKDSARITAFLNNKNNPFLDRFVDGLYAPGSTVKPYLALAALHENIISPTKKIESTGSISLTNIYDSTLQTTFKDWKAHGWVDMRQAIAVSSDVYFYEVGGGYKEQKGLGISNIEKYLKLFGFGEPVQADFLSGKKGTIPNPEWKKENFKGEEWTIGNTYHTAIGQYGVLVTPVQMLLGIATIANDGVMPNITIVKDGNAKNNSFRKIDIPAESFRIVKEGMRLTVTNGTATSMNDIDLDIAGKTGSAEIGVQKKYTNSWFVGFYPYKEPRYAFVFMMERGLSTNTLGATTAARDFFSWLAENRPLTYSQ